MCKSRAEGGQRCATHTSVAYENKLNSIFDKLADGIGPYTEDDSKELIAATTLYATTKKGIQKIETFLYLITESDILSVVVEDLEIALAEGKRQRAITKEVEEQIALARRNGNEEAV